MKTIARLALFVYLLPAASLAAGPGPAALNSSEQVQQIGGDVGEYGGRLIVGQRAEPKTLNPVTATDALSREAEQWLAAHLAECANCSAEDAHVAEALSALRAMQISVPPDWGVPVPGFTA